MSMFCPFVGQSLSVKRPFFRNQPVFLFISSSIIDASFDFSKKKITETQNTCYQQCHKENLRNKKEQNQPYRKGKKELKCKFLSQLFHFLQNPVFISQCFTIQYLILSFYYCLFVIRSYSRKLFYKPQNIQILLPYFLGNESIAS